VLTATRLNKRFKHAIKGEPSSGMSGVMNALDLFLPGSPRNYGQVDDAQMNDLLNSAAYSLNADAETRLVRQINERAVDQCYALERVVGFHTFFRHSWLHNVASAVQGFYCCTGSQQIALAWIDDTAPTGRAGRLPA
jgi:hypothetical protein